MADIEVLTQGDDLLLTPTEAQPEEQIEQPKEEKAETPEEDSSKEKQKNSDQPRYNGNRANKAQNSTKRKDTTIGDLICKFFFFSSF
jgi:hypothetical protein